MDTFRQNVIEHFNNRFIRILIKRNATQKEINKIVIDTEKLIRDLSKELVLEYTIDIDEEDFIKQLENHIIDKAFITKFFNGKSDDKIFRYTHEEIGEFLEYNSDKKYETLVKLIKGTLSLSKGLIGNLLRFRKRSKFPKRQTVWSKKPDPI